MSQFLCWKCGYDNRSIWTIRDEYGFTVKNTNGDDFRVYNPAPCLSCGVLTEEQLGESIKSSLGNQDEVKVSESMRILEESASEGSTKARLELAQIHRRLKNFELAESYLSSGHNSGDWSHSRELILVLAEAGKIDRSEEHLIDAIRNGIFRAEWDIEIVHDVAHAFCKFGEYVKAIFWYEYFPEDNYLSDNFGLIHLDHLETALRSVSRDLDADRVRKEADSFKHSWKEMVEEYDKQLEQERLDREERAYFKDLD